MGVDCSLRKCPFGTAFADKNNAGGVHAYSECSNNGVCDREAGECVCGEGFTGAACDRNVCPNDCSGHGRCTFVEDMASGSYNQWDKNQARGCLCDPYFTGPDCSLRKCPVGDDVLTTEVECGGVSNGMQVDEVQKVTVWADRMLGGEMTLTFTDMYGQAWTTRPIAVGGENIYEVCTPVQLKDSSFSEVASPTPHQECMSPTGTNQLRRNLRRRANGPLMTE